MKKIVACFMILLTVSVAFHLNMLYAKADVSAPIEEPEGLLGQSALLMDAENGRVLFEKEGYRQMPMASTTKILTCLVALEQADGEDIVMVSANAASQPDVQMNICEGEEYRLLDLLYGMMLASYNDVAVAVAEHVGQTVEGFAHMMNEKAEQLGCQNSYFITPNGLDAQDENGVHHTTAYDLALILSAAIQNETFLTITQTNSYTVNELNGKRSASADNHNALLLSMEGMISGKTGFTGDAGYCYAGAVQKDGKTLVAVTLACGWPPHKTYKWTDMVKLFTYGLDYYDKITFDTSEIKLPEKLTVDDGQGDTCGASAFVEPLLEEEQFDLLLREDEDLALSVELPDKLDAPVREGDVIGKIYYTLNNETVKERQILADRTVLQIDFVWMLFQTMRYFELAVS